MSLDNQEYYSPMENDFKNMLAELFVNDRERFGIIFRLLYQWKVELSGAKGFVQLIQKEVHNQSDNTDIEIFLLELSNRIIKLDNSIINCITSYD